MSSKTVSSSWKLRPSSHTHLSASQRAYLQINLIIEKKCYGARRSDLHCERVSRALETQNHVRIASRRGHSPLCRSHLHPLHRASETDASQGNRTRDLLQCRRTLYAKSHSNGVVHCYSEPPVLLHVNIYSRSGSAEP
jgi:hypothetical protein